jgi:AraC-like DNA-binding protein
MPTSNQRETASQLNVREQLTFSLHHVEESSYSSLAIRDMCRPDWTISHVRQGCVQTTTGGESFWAQRGDVMIHPPQVPFCESSSSTGTHEWFASSIQVWPQLDLLQRYPVTPVVTLRSPDEYSRIFRNLYTVWSDSAAPQRELLLLSLTMQLLSAIVQSWQEQGAVARPASMQNDGRFAAVVAHMTLNLERKISRDELARVAHLHPGYFDRVFRSHYGMAPLQMLRDLRLRRAQDLLESTSQTLDAVAHACGLGNAAQLSRAFYARFGQAPGQYRQSAKQIKESYLQSMEATAPHAMFKGKIEE